MLYIFSIYDSGVQAFNQPLMVNHRAYAIRYFTTLAKDEKSDIGRFPASFTLFELGEFDEASGAFNIHDKPVNHGTGSSFCSQET